MSSTSKAKRLLAVLMVFSMMFSLFSIASAESESTEVPIRVVFNVNYIDGQDPTKDGFFDPTKGVDATLDLTKGYQTISFDLSEVKAQLREGVTEIQSFGIIPGGTPYFDEDNWAIVGGWPKSIDTLWLDDVSIGDVVLYKDGVDREFIFKGFTTPMDEDWNELYDSPMYPYKGYGINAVISETEGVDNSECIKFAVVGAVGASWLVYKEPVDISAMADTDKLQMSIDVGKNEYPKWTPDPVSTEKPVIPAPTYEIGPGKEYENISDFAWESLKAGDVVYIYWREEPYKEKFSVVAEGTEDKPIIVYGVPGPDGQLPQIDGSNAVTRPGMSMNQKRGLVVIGNMTAPAKYVTIENLEVFNAHPTKKYIDRSSGEPKPYGNNATGIWVERGENITIRNCVVHDNGNGLFVTSYGAIDYWGEGTPFDNYVNYASKDILIEGNYFYNNGTYNRMFEHNTYCAAINTTYQFNRYGPLLNGSKGYGLKDRGSGTVIRYNWIEGGRRQISLDDAEDTALIAFDPKYNDSYVYGNVLVEPDHKFTSYGDDEIIHFGGDSLTSPYRHGTLYFYNNTVATYRMVKEYGEDAFKPGWKERTVLCYLPSNEQRVDARNNVFYNGGDAPISIITDTGIVDLSHNWISEGWVPTLSDPEESISIVNDDGTNITGKDPGFINPGLGPVEGVPGEAANAVKLIVKYGSDKLSLEDEGIARVGKQRVVTMDAAINDIQGRTMMPAKMLVESLGGIYYWVDADQRIDIVDGLNKISMWIGKSKALVNGTTVAIDGSNPEVTPVISETGVVMVPIRFVAEQIGSEVTWNGADKSIEIIRDVGRDYRPVKDSELIDKAEADAWKTVAPEDSYYQYTKHQTVEPRGADTDEVIGAYGAGK